MSAFLSRWSGPPLALRILALLLAGLIVAQLVTLALTMLLPPDPQPRYRIEDIARALTGESVDPGSARPLERTVQATAPQRSGPGWLTLEHSRRDLARLLGRSDEEVRLFFYTPLPFAGTAGVPRLPRDPTERDRRARAPVEVGSDLVHPALFMAPGGGAGPPGANRGMGGMGMPGPGRAGPMGSPSGSAGSPRPSAAGGSTGSSPRPPAGADTAGGSPPAFPGRDGDARSAGSLPPAASGAEADASKARPHPGTAPPQGSRPDPRAQAEAPSASGDPRIEIGAPDAAAPHERPSLPEPPPIASPAKNTPLSTPTAAAPKASIPGERTSPASVPRATTTTAPSADAGPPRPQGRAPVSGPPMRPPRAIAAPEPLPVPILAPPVSPGPSPRDGDRSGDSRPAQSSLGPAGVVPTPTTPSEPSAASIDSAAGAPLPQSPAAERDAKVRGNMVSSVRGEALPPGPPRSWFGFPRPPLVEGDFVAAVMLPDRTWAVVAPAPEPFPTAWQRRVALWFLISFAIVAPLGWLFSRRLVRPIASFAQAAEQLGRDPTAPILAVDGPAEIGRAAHAFNRMQSRLRTFVEDRTAMIGAISHDLRTPLTRLRFRIEEAPGELRDGMLHDVEQMEQMIASVLEFIRGASEPGARERLDLATILEDVVEDAVFVGKNVTLETTTTAIVDVDAIGVRRVLGNLVENAVKYGNRARVRLFTEQQDAVTEVVDEGPGLAEEELERVFQPFYRAPAARRSGKQGTGLGLAVCRSIARAHGGDVRLRSTPKGLVAQVRLPLAYGGRASSKQAGRGQVRTAAEVPVPQAVAHA